jgi:hypothetical protein
MKKNILFASCLLALLVFWSLPAAAADEGGCIKCHTNDALMKTLHRPVPVQAGAGEG